MTGERRRSGVDLGILGSTFGVGCSIGCAERDDEDEDADKDTHAAIVAGCWASGGGDDSSIADK